jgi:hypothetical protein
VVSLRDFDFNVVELIISDNEQMYSPKCSSVRTDQCYLCFEVEQKKQNVQVILIKEHVDSFGLTLHSVVKFNVKKGKYGRVFLTQTQQQEKRSRAYVSGFMMPLLISLMRTM